MTLINAETTDEELTSQMLAVIPETYQKTVGFLAWDFCRAVAITLLTLWDKLLYISGLDDLSKFNYDDLVRFVFQRRGIVAKVETYSNGLLKVTAGDGGTISSGNLFETPDGLQFEATETKTVALNETFSVKCLTTGPDGNVPANTITVIPTTIQGIVSVINPEAMTGGYEKESKEDLIERYLDDLQNPISSGNIYHYKKWAKEITGVKNADVKSLWNGDNTVKVLIIDSNSEPASVDLVAQVQAYIDPSSNGKGEGQAPIGAYCTVVSATALNLTVTANISLKSGEILSTVRANVSAKIKEYLAEIAFDNVSSYVSYAKIGSCILSADGVADYNTLKINNATNNVLITNTTTDHAVPVLNTLTLTQV